MKTSLILLAALFTAPAIHAADEHGHEHPSSAAKTPAEAKPEHDHANDADDNGHAEAPKGPNGGDVRVSKAGFSYEVVVDSARKLRVAFLDKDGKVAALNGQTISGIAGERSAPTKLTFSPGKDAGAGLLVSDQALPAGAHVPLLLVIKTTPEAKAATERFEMHLH